jgi:hypothetical protein
VVKRSITPEPDAADIGHVLPDVEGVIGVQPGQYLERVGLIDELLCLGLECGLRDRLNHLRRQPDAAGKSE